jgi:hypothetical protein
MFDHAVAFQHQQVTLWQPMRSGVGMSDQPPKDASTKARQGETTGVVRWVLGISLSLVIIGMVVAFLVF